MSGRKIAVIGDGISGLTAAHILARTDVDPSLVIAGAAAAGLIPSVTAIEDSLARGTRLRVAGRHDFGAHYAQTLRIWRDRFLAREDEGAALGEGSDGIFVRMWLFYLCYAEAGFRAGYLNVSQLTLDRS